MPKTFKRPAHISKEDWDAVDSPPLSDEMLAKMRPASEVVPEIVEAYKRSELRKPRRRDSEER